MSIRTMLIHTAEPYRCVERLSEKRDWRHRHARRGTPDVLGAANTAVVQPALNDRRSGNQAGVTQVWSGWPATDKTRPGKAPVPAMPAQALANQ